MNIPTTFFEEQREKIPPQSEIEEFFEILHFPEHATKPFHLSELVKETKNFFNIPDSAASLKLEDYGYNGHGNDGTFLEALVTFGIIKLVNQHKVKKVGPNQWAHIDNPLPPISRPRISKREVGYAIASVKILKSINQCPEQIRQGLSHKWSNAVLEEAITQVFNEKKDLTPHLTSGSI